MTRTQRILVSLLLRSEAGILLLQRGSPYSEFFKQDPQTEVGVGLWELPGGGLDFGEQPLEAAMRETVEETGILVERRNLRLAACCAYTLTDYRCESHRVHVIFKVNVSAPSAVRLSSEHTASQWVSDSEALRELLMIDEVRNVVASLF